MEPIGKCSKIPTSDLYRESNTNKTFPYTNVTKGDAAEINGSASQSSDSPLNPAPAFGVLFAIVLVALGFSVVL